MTGRTPAQVELDHDRDRFLTSEQAVSYGIVDKVLQSRALAE
jgi:ATP-dependent Clp protease protease subunit